MNTPNLIVLLLTQPEQQEWPPTGMEIAEALGLPPATVYHALNRLERRGTVTNGAPVYRGAKTWVLTNTNEQTDHAADAA